MRLHDRFVIWGSSGHAKVLADIIHDAGGRVIALFDNNPMSKSCIAGVPLFHGEQGFRDWCSQESDLTGLAGAIAVGGSRGEERVLLGGLLESEGILLPALIHKDASVSSSATIGVGSQVLANAVVAADAILGAFCIVNNMANVDHECRVGVGVHIGPGATLCGCVEVGDNVFVGASSVILPRLKISTGAIVGAGAVVTRNVTAGLVVVGSPAIPIKGKKND